MKNKTLYPSVTVQIAADRLSMYTTLRKMHSDGKYYLQDIFKIWVINEPGFDPRFLDISKKIMDFYTEVYAVLIIGIIDLSLRDVEGNIIFKEDSDQTSEQDRVKNLCNPHFLP